MAAGLQSRSGIGAVYGLREDAGSTGLADSAGAAEKICMGQLTPLDGVLEGLGYVVLAY